MISFRDFLNEKAMNMKTYSRLQNVVNDTALVGCEFEMLIPTDSEMYSESNSTAPNVSVDGIDFETIDDYFDISRHEQNKMTDEYDEWVEKQLQEYVDDNYKDYIDEENEDADEAEEEARQKARDEAEGRFGPDTEYSDWIEDEFGSMERLVSYFDLTPKYGFTAVGDSVYTEEPSGDVSETHDNVMRHILRLVDRTSYNDAHYDDWKADEDSSIEGDGHGIEVISPPQKLSVAIESIETMFKFMSQYAETNNSTGFHINVSVPNIRNINRVKLIMFLGDRYVLDVFGRSGNRYTSSQYKALMNSLRHAEEIPSTVKELEKYFSDSIKKEKYSSVNFIKLIDGYLEFRIAGGKDYNKKLAEVKEAVHRYVAALEIACDPNAELKEYAKKLVNTVKQFHNTVNDTSTDNSKFGPFSRLVSYDPSLKETVERQINPLGSARSEGNVTEAFTKLLATIQRFKLSMSPQEAAGFRKFFFKQHPDMFKQIFSDITKVNRMKSPGGILIKNPDLINFVKRELKNIGAE